MSRRKEAPERRVFGDFCLSVSLEHSGVMGNNSNFLIKIWEEAEDENWHFTLHHHM